MSPSALHPGNQFQLWFRPLSEAMRERAFPCDASGTVDLDSLHGADRLDYLFARTLIGRDFGRPTVCRATDEDLQ